MQKIENLLNSSYNTFPKFATQKWYVIGSETKGEYSHQDSIKFLTKSIESSICGYSSEYIHHMFQLQEILLLQGLLLLQTIILFKENSYFL